MLCKALTSRQDQSSLSFPPQLLLLLLFCFFAVSKPLCLPLILLSPLSSMVIPFPLPSLLYFPKLRGQEMTAMWPGGAKPPIIPSIQSNSPPKNSYIWWITSYFIYQMFLGEPRCRAWWLTLPVVPPATGQRHNILEHRHSILFWNKWSSISKYGKIGTFDSPGAAAKVTGPNCCGPKLGWMCLLQALWDMLYGVPLLEQKAFRGSHFAALWISVESHALYHCLCGWVILYLENDNFPKSQHYVVSLLLLG